MLLYFQIAFKKKTSARSVDAEREPSNAHLVVPAIRYWQRGIAQIKKKTSARSVDAEWEPGNAHLVVPASSYRLRGTSRDFVGLRGTSRDVVGPRGTKERR